MKKMFSVILLLSILVLPLSLALAQEEEGSFAGDEPAAVMQAQPAAVSSEAPAAPSETAAPSSETAAPKPKPPQTNSNANPVSSIVNQIIALLAPIGAMFGQATGVRIGGTTGTGIAALVGAKVLQDKVPSWVKWILYLTGGTMFAGGGANVLDLVMKYVPQ